MKNRTKGRLSMPASRKDQFEYDICLSFAGEDRKYVAAVTDNLRAHGIRVFYDEYEEVALWGKDLYEHLHEVYSQLNGWPSCLQLDALNRQRRE